MITRPRPCLCDKCVIGQDYVEGDCRQCWLFHHSEPCNRYWGGTGIVKKGCKLKKKQLGTIKGPGTALAEILSSMKLDSLGCAKCKGRAKTMNAWGPDECERRVDEIVAWLRETAKEKGLGFVFTDWGAKLLVLRAIQISRASCPKLETLTENVPPWEIAPLLQVEKRPNLPTGAKDWPNFQEALAQAKHRYKPQQWWSEMECPIGSPCVQ